MADAKHFLLLCCQFSQQKLNVHLFDLQIRPFRNAHTSRSSDNELQHLTDYLRHIATLRDFTDLKHKHWEKYGSLLFCFANINKHAYLLLYQLCSIIYTVH